jgi:hypothetical protein
MTQTTKADAQAFDCPFCGASAGQPCRTRNSGREQEWLHSRRIALTRTEPQYVAPQVSALCCVCGNRRTVSDDYSRRQDPNHSSSELGKAEGWRSTQSLTCDHCGERTRHAVMNRPGATDYDEIAQRCALGDDDTGIGWSKEYVDRLRREYREMFPRNPKLHHLWFRDNAEKAIADGNPRMHAVCGEPIDTPTPERHRRGKPATEPVAPQELTDTEFEDPETGLWWRDLDCVDCLRLGNRATAEWQRRRLERLLLHLSVSPEKIDDREVSEVLEYLERLNGEGNRSD